MTRTTTPTRRPRTGLALAVVGVVVVGVLVWLLWPRGTRGPTVTTLTTAHHSVRLSLPDPTVGSNSIEIDIADLNGAPAVVDTVMVEPVMPQMGHALAPVIARAEGQGRYRATDLVLPMSGQWEITVSLSDTEHVVFQLLVT